MKKNKQANKEIIKRIEDGSILDVDKAQEVHLLGRTISLGKVIDKAMMKKYENQFSNETNRN